jgi:hypothetical protein
MKKLKTYIILISLAIILFFTIKEKHYIEEITNNYLYSDNAKLPQDPKVKNLFDKK